MHTQNFGQTLKLQSAVETLNITPKSSKFNLLFLVSKQCIVSMHGLVEIQSLVLKIKFIKS